jgi:hypothetical protein
MGAGSQPSLNFERAPFKLQRDIKSKINKNKKRMRERERERTGVGSP